MSKNCPHYHVQQLRFLMKLINCGDLTTPLASFGIFSLRMHRNGYLGASGQKSDPIIRYGDLYLQYGVTGSHTRTVVRECFKGDEANQWKRPKFDPSPHQNPLTDLHKNWQA